ncbi:MAG: peptidoglycan bridge formation glycyltransferase FemA/FemB family protein, partial [Spirochaetales bacterium]|nr:peptidoglycan bridge formation glycyltransferase FemA/FemB family protein [Spirochaetales bacterium]
MYIPYAPIEQERLEEVSAYLKTLLPKSCVFIRWDLPWYVKEEGEWTDAPKSFRRATMDIQPPSSVILNISRPLDEILKGMKERARRNIKVAEKKGVVVTCHGVEKLDVWYDLYKETSERDRITVHPKVYYQKLFELASNQKRLDVRLYMASVDGD